MRAQEKRTWHQMFRQGTIVISGFGYFAERAEVEGCTYYNTSLSDKGAKYPTRSPSSSRARTATS